MANDSKIAYILESKTHPGTYKKGNGFTKNFICANTYVSEKQAQKSGNISAYDEWKVIEVKMELV